VTKRFRRDRLRRFARRRSDRCRSRAFRPL